MWAGTAQPRRHPAVHVEEPSDNAPMPVQHRAWHTGSGRASPPWAWCVTLPKSARRCAERPPLRDPYARARVSAWRLYGAGHDIRGATLQGKAMLDIIYLALGVGGFVALMLVTRALGRL